MFGVGGVRAEAEDWQLPTRLSRPELATDEGGLWAMTDREETRLRRNSFHLRDPGLHDYLLGVACKLGSTHCPDLRIYPMRTPWFNASMAPNGMMQVWTGLLLRVDNEAQLAAVLGHEMGHYLQRHSLARLRDARSKSAAASMMAFLGPVGLIGQLAMIGGMYAYSRDHEREADRIGLFLLDRAGYDAREAARVWENLRAELTAGVGGDPAKRSVMFATHPPSDERQQTLARLAGDRGGALGADEFHSRVDPLLPDLIDDELRRAQYDETVVLATRLMAARPQRADLVCLRAEACRLRGKDGDADAALADFDAALTLTEPPLSVHRGRGFILRQQGRRQAAHDAFERYVQAAPGAPDAEIIKTYIDELKT
jgi:predicted Zn-dependent protease